jgi:hypothetical protein
MRPPIAALLLALAVALAAPAAAAPVRPASAAKPKSAAAAPQFALPFIQNDYTRALAEARARKVPLFIEAWAPW